VAYVGAYSHAFVSDKWAIRLPLLARNPLFQRVLRGFSDVVAKFSGTSSERILVFLCFLVHAALKVPALTKGMWCAYWGPIIAEPKEYGRSRGSAVERELEVFALLG